MGKVLVTGADGFIGSHLVEALVESGREVRALCYYNSHGFIGNLEYLPKEVLDKVDIVMGDVRDHTFSRNLVDGCESVFHLAALIAIPFSYQAPRLYLETNVIGTLNLLEASVGKVKKFIHTSTSEVYGTAQTVPIDESHPIHAQSPYAASKAGADELVRSFAASFEIPAVTLRPFNTYGPRQSARAVIPTIISQVLSGVAEIKLGSTSPTRDFLFVKDTAQGFVKAEKSTIIDGDVIQIGTGKEISIGELAQKIISLCGSNARVVCEEERLRPQNSEVQRLIASNEKAKKHLSWEPRVNLDDGLLDTIQWFRNNIKRYRPERYEV